MALLHVFNLAPILMVIMLSGILANQLNFVRNEPLLTLRDHHKSSNFKNNEYMRQIQSMMNARNDPYNERLNEKFLIKTNALIDAKYQTLKRNGDFINSLLTLPKGLMDAGR